MANVSLSATTHRYGVTGKGFCLLPHLYGVTGRAVCLLPHTYGVTGKASSLSPSATTSLWCNWQMYIATGKALSVCYHIVMV